MHQNDRVEPKHAIASSKLAPDQEGGEGGSGSSPVFMLAGIARKIPNYVTVVALTKGVVDLTIPLK